MDTAALTRTPDIDALLVVLALPAELELRRMRTEKRLSRVARQWTATVDTIPDFVAVIDHGYRLQRVNLALARFAGAHPRDLVGRKCHAVLHGLDSMVDLAPQPLSFAAITATWRPCQRAPASSFLLARRSPEPPAIVEAP